MRCPTPGPHADHGGREVTVERHVRQELCDERYRSRDQLWSGEPSPYPVSEIVEVEAEWLNVGSGEGSGAIWLVERGWRATALDVYALAVGRGAKRAAEVGAGAVPYRVSAAEPSPAAPATPGCVSGIARRRRCVAGPVASRG